MEYPGKAVAQGNLVAVLHQDIRPGQGREALGPSRGLHGRGPEKLPVQPVDDDLGAGGCGPQIVSGDVVGMAVGVDDPAQPPAFLPELGRQLG